MMSIQLCKLHLRRLLFSVASLSLMLALALPATAMHPNHPLGFSSEKAYQFGVTDNVDLYSGSLTVAMPIGPFNLNYSSNIWVYEQVFDTTTQQIYTQAIPNRETTAGLGWHLGMGEVYSPNHWYNPTGKWLYVGADGGRHSFYPTLHRNEDDGDGNVFYSRDSTYLRLRKMSGCKVILEFPDGTSRSFVANTCGGGTTHRLTRVWKTVSSESDPDLTVAYDSGALNWTITDRYGRTHYVHLTDQYNWINRVVTQVDIESIAGQRARYDFHYNNILVTRSCKDDDPTTSTRIRLPHLSRIDLPDGSSYSMKEGSNLLYYNLCEGGIDDVSGVLRGMVLPTFSKLEWDFVEYEFPPGDNNSVFNTSAGVGERRTVAADGQVEGTWTYKSNSYRPPGEDVDPEMHTQVVYPTGDCSKHFFNARYWLTPSQGKGWERGLPFVYSEESGGKYLSTQIWSSSTAGGACTGTKLRSTYLKYRKDATPGSNNNPDQWINTNRSVKASRIVFHDDGDRWVDGVNSNFDGLGNFRWNVTTGNFWDSSINDERRATFTNYNPNRGIYPGTFVPIAPSEPWILHTYDYRTVTENDAVGESVSRREFGFDTNTGLLSCRRTLATGTARGANDILVTYGRDALGLVVDIKRYGGDLQALPVGNGVSLSGTACGSLPSEPEYWTHQSYQFGELTQTRPYDSQGNPGAFLTYDVDRDPSTGLVTASRTAAGFGATFTYDVLGRPLEVIPQEGAKLSYAYVNATSTTPASVTLKTISGTQSLKESQLLFDEFGRLWKERRRQPGGVWTERETLYNARGWIDSTSEWGDLWKRTRRLAYDPFGRYTRLRPPQGAAHDVTFTFAGTRRVTETRQVELATGLGPATRIRQLDSHGRIRQLLEPSGQPETKAVSVSGGKMVATDYFYDVGNRLTRIVSGSSVSQTRQMTYDGRGFLLNESHPEKGISGNGTVYYYDRDSLGKAGRRLDGPHDIAFEYDFMGRRTRVRDRNQGNRLLKTFKYDNGGGLGLGKLHQAIRHQWVDLPWRAAGEEEVKVREIYNYSQPGGAISYRRTKIDIPGETTFDFITSVRYDETGNSDWQRYPRCLNASCLATTGTGRIVTSNYEDGLITQVNGWTGAISYHTSGEFAALPHANGVIDHQTIDPDLRSRTKRLYTSGASIDFDTGNMVYDGAGNVIQQGSDSYTYDGVSRIRNANFRGYSQEFTHDLFGNLTEVETVPPFGPVELITIVIDPATNRLTSAGYDGAGNLTSWGPTAYSYYPTDQIKEVDDRFLYLYSAGGERVATVDWTGSVASRKIAFTLRDLSNRVLSQFTLTGVNQAGNWSRDRDYIFGGRRLLASVGGDGTVRHYHLDHLGSVRMVTDSVGTQLASHDFLPYGQEITSSGGELLQFTGHERDAETGLDYMHARHYSSHLGRFLSTDQKRGALQSPQSFNRYSYVRGNPLTFTDPDGRERGRRDGRLAKKYSKCGNDPNCLMLAHIAQDTYPVAVVVEAGSKIGPAAVGLYVSAQTVNGYGIATSITTILKALVTSGSQLAGHYDYAEPEPTGEVKGSSTSAGEWDCSGDGDCIYTETIDVSSSDGEIPSLEGGNQTDGSGNGNGDSTNNGDGDGDGTYTEDVCVNDVCLVVSGSSQEEVEAVAEQLWRDMLAMMGLEDLISGACQINPLACSRTDYTGGGGGGSICPIEEMSCVTYFF